MCGIAGIVDLNEVRDNRDIVSSILSKLWQRGPDDEGLWFADKVTLGHSRLAIIDLSLGGSQPKTDNSGRFTITFNGEIYNFLSLKCQLEDYDFKTKSDTEVILAAYRKWGYYTPNYLKGQFAFAIWDKEKDELFLARDRMGEKPLYYLYNEDQFCFASEIRALLESSKVALKLRLESVSEFLRLQYVCAPFTLLEGVFQVPAAHYGIYKKGQLIFKKYWDITDIESNEDDLNSIHTSIKDKLSTSVQLQMLSDVPLGAFLSGGIDSSAIVALMAEQSSNPVETFSVGFNESAFDESKYAAIVAKKFRTNHHSILLNANDFKNRLPEILSKIDNPSGDGPNTYIVSEAVKKAGLTVALSGLGGDELFAGYDGFQYFYRLQKVQNLWKYSKYLRLAISPLFDSKKRELLRLDSLKIEDFYPLYRSVFSMAEIRALLPNVRYEYNVPWSKEIHNLPVLSQYSVAELTGYTRNVLLKDTDQMSMATSLEVRVPFFDHDFIEYILGIPDKFKFPIYPKSLLVESLKPLLPDEVVHRPKMGFSFPWDQWIRCDLKNFCFKHLSDLQQRPLFAENEILNIWNRFLKRDKEIKWSKIWLLVTLECWLKNINY